MIVEGSHTRDKSSNNPFFNTYEKALVKTKTSIYYDRSWT